MSMSVGCSQDTLANLAGFPSVSINVALSEPKPYNWQAEVIRMAFPVLVEASDGQFSASLVGAPDVRVVGSTRAEAIAALQAEIEQRIARGELLSLEVEGGGVSSLAGRFRTDPTLRKICEDAYKLRDAERS